MTTAYLLHIEPDWFLAQAPEDRVLTWNGLTLEGKAQLVSDLRGRPALASADDDDITAPIPGGPVDPIPTYDNPNT